MLKGLLGVAVLEKNLHHLKPVRVAQAGVHFGEPVVFKLVSASLGGRVTH